jgi:Zincin-like metallopeptidase
VLLNDFRALIHGLEADIPPQFQGGVVEIEVSPKTVPHPVRAEIYTLGECIPLEWSGSGADLQSRIVLYHGSFQALSRLGDGDFDWREEAWETLTHELRHHLEWQANVAGLEAYDWAAEQNFARHDGEPFDPVFYRNGEEMAAGVFKVDDDVFLERARGVGSGERIEMTWHGAAYRVRLPSADRRAWVFLTLEGLDEPPPGEAVLVLPGRASALDVLRRQRPPLFETGTVERLKG